MKKITWSVTYSLVNEEEAEIGDTDRRGFRMEGVSLREAIDALGEDMDEVYHRDFSCSHIPSFGHFWLSVCGRNWHTGDSVENCLHPSKPVSASSWKRVMEIVKHRV